MSGLTPAMRDALLVIQELTRFGVPPSYQEIGRELELATRSAVKRVVDRLAARGYVAYEPGRARTLHVLKPIPVPDEAEFVGLFDAPELAARLFA